MGSACCCTRRGSAFASGSAATPGSRPSCAPWWRRISNKPATFGPKGLARAALDDFAALLARQLGVEGDHARHLVAGDAAGEVGAHALFVEGDARLGLHRRGQRLPEFL